MIKCYLLGLMIIHAALQLSEEIKAWKVAGSHKKNGGCGVRFIVVHLLWFIVQVAPICYYGFELIEMMRWKFS